MYHQRHVSLLLTLFSLALFNFTQIIKPHGFGLETLITMKNAKERLPLLQLARLIVAKGRRSVRAYEEVKKRWVNKHIEGVGFSETDSYCRLLFAQDPAPILCTPKQRFYRMPDQRWVPAHQLRIGDQLLCSGNRTATLSDIILVQEKLPVCTLQVNAAHTFLVGRLEIVTHNAALPLQAFLRFTWKWGAAGGAAGAKTLNPVKIAGGLLIGSTVGLIYDLYTRKTYVTYHSAEGQKTVELYAEEINKNNTPVASARYEKTSAAVTNSAHMATESEKPTEKANTCEDASDKTTESYVSDFSLDEAPVHDTANSYSDTAFAMTSEADFRCELRAAPPDDIVDIVQGASQRYIDSIAPSMNTVPARSALAKAIYHYAQESDHQEQSNGEETSHSLAMTYQEELTQVRTALFDAECDDVERYQARIAAIEQTQQEHGACIQRDFDCSQAACDFAEQYGISTAGLTTGFMNAYTSQLHTEFLEQLHVAEQLHNSFGNAAYGAPFFDVIGCGVAFGIDANEKQQAALATHWADMVWQAIDIASAVAEGVGNGFWNLGVGGVHLAQGAVYVAQGAVHAAVHPLDTIVTVVNGFEKVISLCASATKSAVEFAFFNEEAPIDSLMRKVNTLIGQTTVLVKACRAKINATPTRDKVKCVATIITEFAPGKVLRMLNRIQKSMSPFLTTLLRAMRQEGAATELAAVAAKAEALLMHGAQTATAMGGPGKEIVQDALKMYHGDLIKNLDSQMLRLKTLFDNKVQGFAECAKKFIKVDYEHIFGMELSWNRKGTTKIGGFHQDFMNSLEKSGLAKFANKVMHETGFYKADLVVDGTVAAYGKSFFPADWSQEQIVSAIYEAYANFIQNGALYRWDKGGKYIAEGLCEAKVKIEMFITKNGLITTAYPILQELI